MIYFLMIYIFKVHQMSKPILEEGRAHSSNKVVIINTKPRLDEIPNNNSSNGMVTPSDLLLNKYSTWTWTDQL